MVNTEEAQLASGSTDYSPDVCRRVFPEMFALATLSYDMGDGDLFYKIFNDREEFLRLAKHVDPEAVTRDCQGIDFDVLKSYMVSVDGVYGSKSSLLDFFHSRFPALHGALSTHNFPPGVYLLPGRDYSLLFLWPGPYELSPDRSPLVTLLRILFELSP
ncbi:hypothetical protein RCL1_001597 [Eukaryota sp. TZLM3-RCL]